MKDFSDAAMEAIKGAAQNADEAQGHLDRAAGAARVAGQQSVIDKHSRLAEVKALVAIAQSLSILASIGLDNHIEKRQAQADDA